MSVKIVRTKGGEDIICDLHEVVTKDEQQSVVGFQFSKPYSVYLESANQREFLIEGDITTGIKNNHMVVLLKSNNNFTFVIDVNKLRFRIARSNASETTNICISYFTPGVTIATLPAGY